VELGTVGVAALRLTVALSLTGCVPRRETTTPLPQPISMAALHQSGGVPPGWKFTLPAGNVAMGRALFVEFGCHKCHAVQGESVPTATDKQPGPDLTGMGSHHPAEYFAEAILDPNAVLIDGPGYMGADGRSRMPRYPDMTLAQLADVVAYLQTLTSAGDAIAHAHQVPARFAEGASQPTVPEPAVFLVQVNEVTPRQLKAFDAWFGESGMDDLKTFTGFVSVQTLVNRSAGRRQLVTVFGFDSEAALEDFVTQAQAADAPAELDALLRQGKGAVFRSTILYKAVGLSLP
jgi:mono/diheme cytochrome c family protein